MQNSHKNNLSNILKNKANYKKIKSFLLPFGIIAYLLYIFVFDDASIKNLIKEHKKITYLKQKIQFYQRAIAKDSTILYKLQHDDNFLENFARNKYFFHKPDETIFIIKEQK